MEMSYLWALYSFPQVLIFCPTHSLYSWVMFCFCIESNYFFNFRIKSNMMAFYSSDILSTFPKARAVIYSIIVQRGNERNLNHRYYSCFVSYTVSFFKEKYKNKICSRIWSSIDLFVAHWHGFHCNHQFYAGWMFVSSCPHRIWTMTLLWIPMFNYSFLSLLLRMGEFFVLDIFFLETAFLYSQDWFEIPGYPPQLLSVVDAECTTSQRLGCNF